MDTNSGERLAPVQHEAAFLRNKIIASLRRAIELGVLQPGTRLVEKDLCEQLDVSRTSLREALRELQADGILSHMSNRGLVVARITRRDAENIYRIRSVLEALIVEQFIENASDAAIRDLKNDSSMLKEAYKTGNVERIMAAKRAFYDRICTGAQNPVAFDILNRLTLRTSQLRSRSLMQKKRQQQSVKEIDTLIRAIEARDAEAARKAAESHVANAASSALQNADLEP